MQDRSVTKINYGNNKMEQEAERAVEYLPIIKCSETSSLGTSGGFSPSMAFGGINSSTIDSIIWTLTTALSGWEPKLCCDEDACESALLGKKTQE